MSSIESVALGDPVVTFDHTRTRSCSIHETRPPRLALKLVHYKQDGTACQISLLRTLDWIEDYGAHEGGQIYLDMPEMSAVGLADVIAIEPCPDIQPGPGRLVTGTFQHTAGIVLDLKVESESKPIGVTPTHPFWSVDRQGWVAAGDLHIGERLETLNGTTVVESIVRRPEPETVYNIEVEGDHVYRVGESGILVHNASTVPSEGHTGPVVVYRGDDRDPSVVFAQGFKSYAKTKNVTPNYDVAEHVEGCSLGKDTGYIATTKTKEDAAPWGTYVYKIHITDGIDVDEYYVATTGKPYYSGLNGEDEILAINVIPNTQIEGAYPKAPTSQDMDNLGNFIKNPNFKAP